MTVVIIINVPAEVWDSKCVCNQWIFLKTVIQISVNIGIIIHKDGLAVSSNQYFKIALNHTINFNKTKDAAKVIKNVDHIKPIVAVTMFELIAVLAANHTQTITNANAERSCAKLLFSTKSAFHFWVINLIKYSLNIFKAKNQTNQKATNAPGNKYSTINQSLGINIAHNIKETFIVIARVNGSAISVTSAFHVFNLSKAFVFFEFEIFF